MAVLSPLPHDYTRPNTESNFEARAITSLAKKQQSILRKIADEKPIRVNLNLPYKPLEPTLSRADLSTEWSAEKPSHADIIIHQHYHPAHHHRRHNHHQHPHHYHHLIILINGSSRRSIIIIIIISTIFIIIISTSPPLSFLSSKSLQNHFHHHRRRRHRYYNCLEQKHVEKEVEYMPYSVGYHCYFISQSTKALQLKKRARF